MTTTGAKYYQRYVPFPIRQGFINIYGNGKKLLTKASKMVDKWSSPTKEKGGASAKRSAGSGTKSRRARNAQARED